MPLPPRRRWPRVALGLVLGLYIAALLRLLVFKIETLHLGRLRFRFATHPDEPNYIPFKSILTYLRGEPSALIAALNLVGNVALFAPVGFLLPLVFPKMTASGALALALALIAAVEGAQIVFHVGILDVDDVILNALGVMLGFGASRLLARPPRPAAT